MSKTLYDHPKYYDLLFGSDWRAEFDFLHDCFEKHAERTVSRLFEPACGTGRLLIKLAQAGFEVAGLDLNPHAVKYCNDRLERNGFPGSAVVGDMSDFTVDKKFDAAFNTINSFRHLNSEEAAVGHLRSVAEALNVGGIYVLGLHLTPLEAPEDDSEAWSATRGTLTINSIMQSLHVNKKKREERVSMTVEIYTPTDRERIQEEIIFRTYTKDQMKQLIGKVVALELVETYDFGYNIGSPVVIDDATEDAVYVLRKR